MAKTARLVVELVGDPREELALCRCVERVLSEQMEVFAVSVPTIARRVAADGGLLFDGPCYVEDGDGWQAVWCTGRRAVEWLGPREIQGAMCAVFACDDAMVRAVAMPALRARKPIKEDL